MDFMDILKEASGNMKKASAAVRDLDRSSASDRERQAKLLEQQRQLEKYRKLKRQTEQMEKQLLSAASSSSTKPTGSNKSSSSIDPERIAAFRRKQEKQKQKAEAQKSKNKQELMQMRIQAHGGKVTKKIADQFGANAIDLQARYGTASGQLEKLVRQETREREESDRLREQWAITVANTIAQKRKRDPDRYSEEIASKRPKTNVISNTVASSSKNITMKTSKSSVQKEEPLKLLKKKQLKRLPAAPLDFLSLMNQAAEIQKKKAVKEELDDEDDDEDTKLSPSPPPMKKPGIPDRIGTNRSATANEKQKTAPGAKSGTNSRANSSVGNFEPAVRKSSNIVPVYSREKMDKRKIPTAAPKQQLSGNADKKQAMNSVIGKANSIGQQNHPNFSAFYGSTGKRFLPGDLRCRDEPSMTMKPGDKKNNALPTGNRSIVPPSQTTKQQAPVTTSNSKLAKTLGIKKESSSSQNSRGQHQKRYVPMNRDDISINQIKACQRLEQEQRARLALERHRSDSNKSNRPGPSSSSGRPSGRLAPVDNGDEEDEYDSEMEDFIDDDPLLDDELQRQDFEETLKLINPRYNKEKWKERERGISLHGMVSNYRQIVDEERRSARMGLMEDIKEAAKGSKGLS